MLVNIVRGVRERVIPALEMSDSRRIPPAAEL
jgi:hypothetical protein